MSVYIKGMEMPHDCDECKLCAFIPVGDYGINRKCMPLNAKAEISTRRTDCPLVPVPDHGRLIDADALRCLYDPHDYGLDGEQADEYDRYHVSLPVIRQNIDDMPTIIEAEEGE